MKRKTKQLSNSYSTGHGGANFENSVQTAFTLLMLTKGFSPCLPIWPIVKIKLQGKYLGFQTDDLIVYCEEQISGKQAKLLAQIKHSIKFKNSDPYFRAAIGAAWQDFKNIELFSEESKDVIVLICGLLSANDTYSVRQLLQQARNSTDSEDFITRIKLAKFTGTKQRNILEVFRTQLKSANNNTELTNEEVFRFLRSYYLIVYDFDTNGSTLPLFLTLIEQFSHKKAYPLWTLLEDFVKIANQGAATISISSIPEDIIVEFKGDQIHVIPNDYVNDTTSITINNWNNHSNANDLVIACLVGSWNENSPPDKSIISQLACMEYDKWIPKLREVLQFPDCPVSYKDGIWSIRDRQKLWLTLGSRIFDEELDILNKCSVIVLNERDPKFELPKEKRFAASIYKKELKYSKRLRKGLAESLALLGCQSEGLKYCSLNKPYLTSLLSIRDIFKDDDWVLWASLSDLLPLIAEAAPDEFLSIIEHSLQKDPCPFDNIYSEEGSGITGWNYMTGILWALETLAWDENFLVPVSVILAELAGRDPGGNWMNRPSNSLTTIFLPWSPQTAASFDKRKVAVQTIIKETPDVAWKFMLSLIPSLRQISMGTQKPKYRNSIPQDWNGKVSTNEYREQVIFYSNLTVEMSKDKIDNLTELIRYLDNLPPPAFDTFLTYLSSDNIISQPEEMRLSLWTSLLDFTTKHKCYSDAHWALDSSTIEKIDKVVTKLEPHNLINLYARLFSDNDSHLYEKQGDWEEQQKELEERRKLALKEIIAENSFDNLLELLNKVNSPYKLGYTLGSIAENKTDNEIIPVYLETKDNKLEQFTRAYVWIRFWSKGWDWANRIISKEWTESQVVKFFTFLPFTLKTWNQVSTKLANSESLYWKQTVVDPYMAQCNLSKAIDKLIEYGRPYAAIYCIYKELYDKKPLDIPRTINALKYALSSQEDPRLINVHYVTETIKALQNDSNVDINDMYSVEWGYLPFLEEHNGVLPKYLNNRLATDSSFFCEIIRLTYRSKNTPQIKNELTENEKALATNAWRLLDEWHIPPGSRLDGTFDEEQFKKWLKETWDITKETGHLEVALLNIGKVLFNCPTDQSGFWINKTAAEALNMKETDEMRSGFFSEVFNSRGFHMVDPLGKPELKYSEDYRKKAVDTENAGYQRFAVTLRKIAEHYEYDARQIIEQHKPESQEAELLET